MYRQNKGLSPEEFAETLYVTKNYIDKLESKSIKTRRAVSVTFVLEVCKRFNDWSLYEAWEQELNRVIEIEKQTSKLIG